MGVARGPASPDRGVVVEECLKARDSRLAQMAPLPPAGSSSTAGSAAGPLKFSRAADGPSMLGIARVRVEVSSPVVTLWARRWLAGGSRPGPSPDAGVASHFGWMR